MGPFFVSVTKGGALATYLNPVRDREEWVQARVSGIGGSDAGTLLRVGWGSVTGLWKEKLGHDRSRFDPNNRYIYWGNLLEDRILQHYAWDTGDLVLGRDVWGRPTVFSPYRDTPPVLLDEDDRLVKWLNPVVSPKRPYARANVDGYALRFWWPVRALEIKNTGADNRNKWEYLPPDSYLVQCIHNREVLREAGLGIPMEIVALIGGNLAVRHWVSEHEELRQEMLRREAQFWFCVQHRRPPRVKVEFPKCKHLFSGEDGMGAFPKANSGVEIPLVPEGSYQGVLVDFPYVGKEKVQFQGNEPKMQHKCLMVFALPSLPKLGTHDEEGVEYPGWAVGTRTVAKKLTFSSSENSNLYKILSGWFGSKKAKAMAKTMKAGTFDGEKLVGQNAIVTVQHWESADGQRTGAGFTTVAPILEGMKKLPVPDDYVPWKPKGEEAEEEEAPPPPPKQESSSEEDDELPF